MPSCRLSKKAVADLVEIGKYTTEIWGKSQRDTYLKQIDECFTQLSENPNLGLKCDYIREGYRKFPQASHMIYYRLNSKNVIEIIRILHKSMDADSKFQKI